MFESKVDEAYYILDWHMYSDKTKEVKQSNMTIEEAEAIIFNHEKQKKK